MSDLDAAGNLTPEARARRDSYASPGRYSSTTPASGTTRIRMPDQRSVAEQLQDLERLANQNGLYDAADWLRERRPKIRP